MFSAALRTMRDICFLSPALRRPDCLGVRANRVKGTHNFLKFFSASSEQFQEIPGPTLDPAVPNGVMAYVEGTGKRSRCEANTGLNLR